VPFSASRTAALGALSGPQTLIYGLPALDRGNAVVG